MQEKESKDLVLAQPGYKYVSGELDYTWTADFTKIVDIWVFVIVDYPTRRVILSEALTEKPGGNTFTVGNTIQCFLEAMDQYQKPVIVHTDLGSQFVGPAFKKFLEKQNIVHLESNAAIQPHQNQVIERFNRTLKDKLKKKGKGLLKLEKKPNDLKWFRKYGTQEKIDWISQIMQEFNQKPHSHLMGRSPVEMESALALHPIEKPLLPRLADQTSEEGQFIRSVKEMSVLKREDDLVAFIIDWRVQTMQQHKEALERIEDLSRQVSEESRRVIDAQQGK